MMQQAADLLAEGKELKKLLDALSPKDWERHTPFKNWTINQVVQHLHGADKAAVLSLTDEERFLKSKSEPKLLSEMMNPTMEGEELLATWWNYFQDMCKSLARVTRNAECPGSVPIWALRCLRPHARWKPGPMARTFTIC